jgi:hypothetical protein
LTVCLQVFLAAYMFYVLVLHRKIRSEH